MKLMVLNSSGNVGKTTVTRELLYAHMNAGVQIFEIETVNASSSSFQGLNVEKINDLTNFDEIYVKLITTDDCIFDVGASCLTAFLEKLASFAGVETMFDYFVIPTVATDKIMTDTARTILTLKEGFGVENDKIKVIFNNVKSIAEFDLLIRQSEKIGYEFDTSLAIPASPLFNELGVLKKTIDEIYNEDVNVYKDQIISAAPEDRLRLVKTDLANRQAVAIKPKLISVFESAFGVPAMVKTTTTSGEQTPVVKEEVSKKEKKAKKEDPAEEVAPSSPGPSNSAEDSASADEDF